MAMAGWQSGYAAACKAVDAGSIPTPALFFYQFQTCPGGGTGRRKGLKIPREQSRAGSIPASGMNKVIEVTMTIIPDKRLQ